MFQKWRNNVVKKRVEKRKGVDVVLVIICSRIPRTRAFETGEAHVQALEMQEPTTSMLKTKTMERK